MRVRMDEGRQKAAENMDRRWSRGSFLVVQLLLGTIFIISGLGKVLDPAEFILTMQVYDLLPRAVVPVVASIMMWTELLIGLLLAVDCFVQGAALLASGFLTLFIGVVLISIQRGISADCGCFDLLGLEEKIGPVVVIRDLVFLAFAVIILFYGENRRRFYGLGDRWTRRRKA